MLVLMLLRCHFWAGWQLLMPAAASRGQFLQGYRPAQQTGSSLGKRSIGARSSALVSASSRFAEATPRLLPPPPPFTPIPPPLQGTQSSRFYLYDSEFNALASAQVELAQIYPHAG